MVFNVRCFKCGENDVRLVLGGRSIIHAQCHNCDTNLLAEVMEFQQQIESGSRTESLDEDRPDPGDTSPGDTIEPVSTAELDEEQVSADSA